MGRPFLRIAALLVTLAPIGACSYIAASGPYRNAVRNNATMEPAQGAVNPAADYALVPMSTALARELINDDRLAAFTEDVVNEGPAHVTIGVGDILNISIFEANSGGLFIPADAGSRPGNFVALPNEQVDASGTINVPYAGTLRAAGLTPQELQTAIERKLANRALEPQVVVTLFDRRSGAINVLGDVNNGVRFTIDPGGERILGALARSGGVKSSAFEETVTLVRAGRSWSAQLAGIAANPSQNIQLRAGDTVYVLHEPRYFLVFGATGNASSLNTVNRRVAFTDKRLTIADGLATAGGLDDATANPSSVFLYRLLPKQTLINLGVPVKPNQPDLVPTILDINLRDPSGFFISNSFPLHAEDIMYVANAPAVDLQKFISVLGTLSGAAASSNTLR